MNIKQIIVATLVGITVITLTIVFIVQKDSAGVQLWENGPYWAECNVGATKPEEAGYYFWWGDTVGYKRNADGDGWVSVKNSTSFKFDREECRIPISGYKKDEFNNRWWAELVSEGFIDVAGDLVALYDAATVYLGTQWRMPTGAEFAALINNCDAEWTMRNGVYGRLVKGRGAYAANSIFLPAAGIGSDNGFERVCHPEVVGSYWSLASDPSSSYDAEAHHLMFDFERFVTDTDECYLGMPVRPVRGPIK